MTKTQKPTAGELLYKANGQLRARVESVQEVGDLTYYTITRYIKSRESWAKTTSTYRWCGR